MEFADEMGFLIIEEIPIYQLNKEQFTTLYLINAQHQLWEMIHRDQNHTSADCMVCGTECETNCPEGREFFKSLLEVSRKLDPPVIKLMSRIDPCLI